MTDKHQIEVLLCALKADHPVLEPFMATGICMGPGCGAEIVFMAEALTEHKLCNECARHMMFGAAAAGVETTVDFGDGAVQVAAMPGVTLVGPGGVSQIDPATVAGTVCQRWEILAKDMNHGPCQGCGTRVMWPVSMPLPEESRKICTRCFVDELKAKGVPGADRIDPEALEKASSLAEGINQLLPLPAFETLSPLAGMAPVAMAAAGQFYSNTRANLPHPSTELHAGVVKGKDGLVCALYTAFSAEHSSGLLKGLSPDDMLAIGAVINAVDLAFSAALGVDHIGQPLGQKH